MRPAHARAQWLVLGGLALAAGLLAGCPPAPRGPVARPHAPWMEVRHPGPFTALGDPGLGLSERCTACHQFGQLATVEPPGNPHAIPATADSSAVPPEPADPLSVTTAHPGGWLRWHNPSRFACTACHGGNGAGVSYSEAGHAQMAPLHALPAARESGAAAGLSPMLQARCGVCHSGEYVPSAPLLSRGRSLIRELNCAGCHAVSPQLAGTGGGPSLARAAEKLAPEVLFHKPNTAVAWQGAVSGQMPQFNLSEDSRLKLTAYLQSLVPAEQRQSKLPALAGGETPGQGLEVLRSARCANCHALPVQALPEADPLRSVAHGQIGPSLERIHERVSTEWITEYLAEPHSWYPDTRMPAYSLDQEQRRAIAAWLVASARAQHASSAPAAALREDAALRGKLGQAGSELHAAGRAEFVSAGCAGCHSTGDAAAAARLIGPSLVGIGDKPREQWPDKARANRELETLADYLRQTVLEPGSTGPGLMPAYNVSDADREAIVTALLAETAAVWPGTDKPLPAQYVRDLGATAAAAAPSPHGADFRRAFWRFPQTPQGSGGASNQPGTTLALAERDLHPRSCAVCHREQYLDWKQSRHALAMGPGVTGQMADWVRQPDKQDEYHSCLKCHATLAEQSHIRQLDGGTWESNPHYAGDELYVAGLTCVSCHVRAHTRFGPDTQREEYQWDRATLSAHKLERTDFLRDSAFCAHCHQFDASQRISNGPPLQNTHVEHREWLAKAAQPQSCQDCHMPGGSHRWQGIHDQQFVADSLDITYSHTLEQGRMRATITLANMRGGHHFPTYVTPRVFLHGYFTDSAEAQIEGTFKDSVIGRDARNREKAGGGTEWYDVFDTRVAAGDSFTFSYDEDLPPGAAAFHLEVFCAPDHFYHEAYGKWLEQEWRSAAGKEQLAAAEEETAPERTGFYLLRERFPLD